LQIFPSIGKLWLKFRKAKNYINLDLFTYTGLDLYYFWKNTEDTFSFTLFFRQEEGMFDFSNIFFCSLFLIA